MISYKCTRGNSKIILKNCNFFLLETSFLRKKNDSKAMELTIQIKYKYNKYNKKF